jgi:hypothetical protein
MRIRFDFFWIWGCAHQSLGFRVEQLYPICRRIVDGKKLALGGAQAGKHSRYCSFLGSFRPLAIGRPDPPANAVRLVH